MLQWYASGADGHVITTICYHIFLGMGIYMLARDSHARGAPLILEVLMETGSAAVSCEANRTKTVCRTVEHMNSFLLKSIT